MKSFLIVLVLSLALSDLALATGPEYYSSRDSIKKWAHVLTANEPKEIIYLGVIKSDSGFLVPYRNNLKIQDLIEMTSYKGSTAEVTVLRAANRITPVFGNAIKPGDKIDFVLKPEDVVWITEPGAPE